MQFIIAFIIILFVTSSAHAYTHMVELQAVVLKSIGMTPSDVRKIVKRAQRKFDKCQVELRLGEIKTIDRPELEEWETFWFNSNQLTEQERWLAEAEVPKGPTLIFVNSLNWTLEGQGTWAAAYAPFLLEHGAPNKKFFREHMLGKVVIGKYRARWSVAHELGHALMNLQHLQHASNIMHTGAGYLSPQFDSDYLMISNLDPNFTREQCEAGIAASPYIVKKENP